MSDDNEKKSSENLDIKEAENEEKIEKDEAESEKEAKEEWIDLLGSGCIRKKVVKEGVTNTKPPKQFKCRLNYECTLDDGTVVEKEDGFEMYLGDCEVIQGLDVAISLMNVCEVCLLIIEPRLAYGTKGLEPLIPPNATLHYKVELLSADYEELEDLGLAARKQIGNKKRKRGNWWYGRGDYAIAIQSYRRALDFLDEVESGTLYENNTAKEVSDSDLQELLEDRINVYNNMAAAQIKLQLFDAALTSLSTVIRCQPNNVKALFRQAKVFNAKFEPVMALKYLMKAKELSPDDPEIQKEISKLQKLLDKQKVSERELAKRMFGGLSTTTETSKSNTRLKMFWMTLGVSIAVGLAGAAYRFKFP